MDKLNSNWRFIMNPEGSELAAESEFKAYAMLEIAIEVNRYNKEGFLDKPNSVYLPTIGNSTAVTSITKLKIKPQNYFQIVLNPKKVNPNYLTSFFNSDQGIKWRKSLESGAVILKINKGSLVNSEVYLPNLEIQQEVLVANSIIRDVLTELNIEKRNLWKKPENAKKIQEKFEKLRFSNEDWINSLPFPLASILWSYDSELDGMVKFKYLLRFFEAFSQFNLTLILSAIKSDEKFYDENFKKCIGKMHDNWFLRPDFGSWNILGMCFSKKIRVILEKNDKSRKKLENLFGTQNINFLRMISNKKLYNILEEARKYRNMWDAHDTPAITLEECNKRTETLFSLVLDLKELTSDLYNTILFFLPMKGECKGGEYYYEIRKLKGPNAYLKKDKIRISKLTGMLDGTDIYFINDELFEPIKLLPLVKIMKSPQEEPNACYFYNRMEGNTAHLVTYHYKIKHAENIEFKRSDLELFY